MAYRVKLTPRAQKDAEELYRWQRCPISPEGVELREEVRQLLYGRRPYRILFLIKGEEVQVLHVRRGARKSWNPAKEIK